MQVTLSEAGSGSKSANETLSALGLTFKELQALEPDKQFEVLADRISGLKDPADRTRAAVELFGRAGADLLPLFEQGAAGIEDVAATRHFRDDLVPDFRDRLEQRVPVDHVEPDQPHAQTAEAGQ